MKRALALFALLVGCARAEEALPDPFARALAGLACPVTGVYEVGEGARVVTMRCPSGERRAALLVEGEHGQWTLEGEQAPRMEPPALWEGWL